MILTFHSIKKILFQTKLKTPKNKGFNMKFRIKIKIKITLTNNNNNPKC